MNRRRFLQALAASTCAAAVRGCAPAWGAASQGGDGRPKVLIVFFGGGTRSSESIDDPRHRFIPRLWNEMVPRGTLMTNVQVQGTIVHPNCVASALTGHVEWAHLDWSRPVAHPTVFEIHRKARGSADTDAWAFMYASILAKAGHSDAAGHGLDYAANVVEPPTIPRPTGEAMDRLMRSAAASGDVAAEYAAARRCAELARSTSRISREGLRSDAARAFLDRHYEAWKAGTGTTSHDAFLADAAIAVMKKFAPAVVCVAFGEIDCAHYGSWSRYVEAIRRTDELTWRLWRATEELDAYRGNTLMLVLPDHGRELDGEGRFGFIHHGDFYTRKGEDEGCRRVWMLAIGGGYGRGQRVERPVPNTRVAGMALEHLGIVPPVSSPAERAPGTARLEESPGASSRLRCGSAPVASLPPVRTPAALCAVPGRLSPGA